MLIETTFATPFGFQLEVSCDEHYVYRAVFTDSPDSVPCDSRLTRLIASELDAYFNNSHHHFQLPLKPQGSMYQQRVWNALLVIPVASTMTYGEMARQLESSPRAIGQACKTNPLALFIPCHRVVGKTSLGGFMGRANALDYKIALLDHEQRLHY